MFDMYGDSCENLLQILEVVIIFKSDLRRLWGPTGGRGRYWNRDRERETDPEMETEIQTQTQTEIETEIETEIVSM